MREQSIHCELITWGQVYRLSRRVAGIIRGAGFKPDVVVAIARGGYVPARLLCDFLDIYNLVSIRVAHYEAGARLTPQARLSSPLPIAIRDLEILLVDDVSDTGDTLALAIEHIASFAPARIRVATLHHKQVSPIIPDFFGQRILAWRWLVYPWAVMEDLSGFIARMSPQPDSAEQAVDQLKLKHGIDVPLRTAEDVLALVRQRRNSR